MGRYLMRQQGWTLFEMVLTIALTGVIFGLLALSLYKPIQDFFWLQNRQEQIKPLLLASETLGQIVARQASQVELRPNQLQIGSDIYDCSDSELKFMGSDERLLAENVSCSFALQSAVNGWVVQFHLNALDDESSKVDRIYFIQGASNES